MKKLLLLGGSAQQVVAIETAKKLGYYTVLCDFLEDNPGQYVVDKFYLVSTTVKEAILEVAQKEQIDGIVAYASDLAAPTAAYVAEKMGLHSNPYESVETLCNKDRFRKFLAENGFHTPKAGGYSTEEEVLKDIARYEFPIIIKPVDSSGSKGATVLHSRDGVEEAVEFAFSFSRSHRIIVEEFIEKKHPYLVGGDIFVQDGKVILWRLLNCHRDRSDLFLKLEIIKKTYGIIMLAIAVFCFDSPIAIAMTGIFTTWIGWFVNAFPNKKLLGYSYFEQIKDVLPSMIMALIMCGIVLLVGEFPLNNFVLLVVQVLTGVVVYLSLSVIFKPEPYRLLVSKVKELIKK